MRTLLLLACALLSGGLYAQINSFPYSQSFESAFTTGHRTEFLPNWWGNYVVTDTMGQYTGFAHTGSYALYFSPEGEEFKVIAQVKLNLTSAANMYTEFWVASRKNGLPEDQKRVKLNVGVSLDGGKTFPFVKGIGPHEGFPNANTAFEKFMFVFPPAANGQANVVLRFLTKSSGGPHRPATLLLDDIDIIQAPSDIFPPYIMGNELPISGLTKLTIPFSEPLLPSVALNPANYQFLWPVEDHDTPVTGEGPLPRVAAVLLSPDGYTATLTLNPPMLVGETYLLEMYAMTDLNGNTAATLSVDGIVYNEPAPGTLVFSEVLFADPSRANPKTKLQYVEIFNASTDIVPLGGLRIKGAIAAHNLPNVKLKPGEFWVATRNAEAYFNTFGQQAWEWKGSWIESIGEETEEGGEEDEGEPAEPQSLYIQTTNRHGGALVDSIGFDFSDPRWIELVKPGYSIEVCDPFADNLDPANWSLSNNNRNPYTYSFQGNNYDIFATPTSGCYVNEDTPIIFCTYSQGFFGNEGGTVCSPIGPDKSALQLMQYALPAGQQQAFGLVATNRYFILKGSDVTAGHIFDMLPGGGYPAPLRYAGVSTFTLPGTWAAVPLSTQKNQAGKIQNVLLSQTITLFFNLRLNTMKPISGYTSLSKLKLKPVLVVSETDECSSSAYNWFKYRFVLIPQRVIDYLNRSYTSGATVENLFNVSNRILGADPALVRFDKKGKPVYSSICAAEIAYTMDAINKLFYGCRMVVPLEDKSYGNARLAATPIAVDSYEDWSPDYTENQVITYPNPFTDRVTIEFTAPVDARVTVQIFSSTGNLLTTLFASDVTGGEKQQVVFIPSQAGLYFYKITLGTQVIVGRLLSASQ